MKRTPSSLARNQKSRPSPRDRCCLASQQFLPTLSTDASYAEVETHHAVFLGAWSRLGSKSTTGFSLGTH